MGGPLMKDLKKKIYDIAGKMQLVNFATVTEEGKPWVRYVTGRADEKLDFRFCTHLSSRKVDQIRNNNNVHISLGVSNYMTAKNWVQIAGVAEILTDKHERDDFWMDELKKYFSGPDDPEYCIVLVRPYLIEFGTMGNMETEVWTKE